MRSDNISIGTNIVLNLPDDQTIPARGVVNTSAQTFTGTMTFTDAAIFSTMTSGSDIFCCAGLVSHNNPNLLPFWDNTNARLGHEQILQQKDSYIS
ncbi:MAG: hypothetical protein KatS3mg083_298 [Candidatus Dojkabacteria bacterium]|nr:MAG: hypothetical protein KatS3mg083_298 [Candidatus Dojkabacteria bacterium]